MKPSILFTWIIDEDYALLGYLSVLSFVRNVQEEAEILVFADENIADNILEYFQQLDPRVLVKKVALSKQPVVLNRLWRMKIVREYSGNRMVFLVDADTIFTSKFSSLFSTLNAISLNGHPVVVGVVEHECARDAYLYFNDRKKPSSLTADEKEDIFKLVFGDDCRYLDQKHFNCGFIGFCNASGIANDWQSMYEKGLLNSSVNQEDDQLPLALAMHKNKADCISLSPAFNSFGNLNGDYAVFHAWGGKWLNEVKLGLFRDFTFTDIGNHYRQLVAQTPQVMIDSFIRRHDLDPAMPMSYLNIDGNFDFEEQYTRYVRSASGNGSLNCLEIGSYSNGKGLAFLIETVKGKFSLHKIYSLLLGPAKGIVQPNLQKISLLDEVIFIDDIQQLPTALLDFVFMETDLHYGDTLKIVECLLTKLRPGSVIGGYDFTGKPYHQAQKSRLEQFCRDRDLALHFEYKCFLITKQ